MTYTNTETEFSNVTHDTSIKNDYIKLFKNENIKIISTIVPKKDYTKENQNHDVDYRIIINEREWNEISFTIRKKFRRPEYKSYQDLIIRYAKNGISDYFINRNKYIKYRDNYNILIE